MTYVIGTAGHVDHGKSTLVKALTGIDPDRLVEEKEREMTIDLGFAWLDLPGGEAVGIVDVPGHRDFIENMLAGVGGIDLALLIIAADEGVMPQTREHLAILDLLDIPAGIVALTKTDLIQDAEWLELVMLDVEELLDDTALENAPIVPVSAYDGSGLDELLHMLDVQLSERPPRTDRGRPRLPADRVFTVSGFGTVVTGTLSGGYLRVGDDVEVVPGRQRARVRGLQSHKESLEVAQPGSRVAINLSGIDRDDVQRGDVIASPGLLQQTTLVDTLFRYLPALDRPLKHNTEVKFFSGAAESLAHVRLIGDRELLPGSQGWLQIRLHTPVALDRGDRFILRYPSPPQTIGGGEILDPHPPHRWRRFKPEVLHRFETLSAGTPDELIMHELEGQIARSVDHLAQAVGMTTDALQQTMDPLITAGDIIPLPGGWLMARASWDRTAEMVNAMLTNYHAQFPLRLGMPREALRSKLGVEGKVFNALVSLAIDAGWLVDEGTVLRLPGHVVTFSSRQEAAIAELFDLLAADPINTPHVKDAVALVGEEVFEALQDRGDIVQVSEDVFFAADTYAGLVERLRDYLATHDTITVAEARDLFDTTRKYVLALLEYLDGAGITRRVGDKRVLRGGQSG